MDKRNQQNHIENHFNVENCFKNLKSVINDEFESLKRSFLKEVIIFKNELLQLSIAKTTENHSERLIGHLESHILFLQGELKEKRSAREFIIRPNILMQRYRFIETTTKTNKESKKSDKKMN